MKSRDFCYWLQGFFEIRGPGPMSAEQAEMVQRHLGLVFKHEIDPSFGPSEAQKALDKIHQGTGTGVGPPIYRC